MEPQVTPTPRSFADKLAYGAALVAAGWFALFLFQCMPYFMRPLTRLREMEATIAARAPQAARFKELDEAGRRALALELLPLLNDPDKMTRAGARHYLARIAWLPGAPAEEMVAPLLADLRQAQGTPDGAAGILARLGEPGRAALFEALSSSNTWTVDAAAFELARIKPPPAGAADAVRAALERTPSHLRLGLRISLDRLEGRRR